MTTLTFDKLAYVDRLKEAGIDERQARALADGLDHALREEIVTKADLKAGLDDVRAEIAASKAEFKGDIAVLDGKLGRHDWMIGSVIALCFLILGKLLLPH